MLAVLSTDGVVFTDIDDMYNRMTVGVEDPATHGPIVRVQLIELRVPIEAVEIVQQDPPTLYPGKSSKLPEWLGIGLISAVIALAGLLIVRKRRPGQPNEPVPSASPAGHDAYV
jgi:hypothetical protein